MLQSKLVTFRWACMQLRSEMPCPLLILTSVPFSKSLGDHQEGRGHRGPPRLPQARQRRGRRPRRRHRRRQGRGRGAQEGAGRGRGGRQGGSRANSEVIGWRLPIVTPSAHAKVSL